MEEAGDGYNNKKPNDANYFKKRYQDKTKQRCAVYATHVVLT